jgi:hypothetical protein
MLGDMLVQLDECTDLYGFSVIVQEVDTSSTLSIHGFNDSTCGSKLVDQNMTSSFCAEITSVSQSFVFAKVLNSNTFIYGGRKICYNNKNNSCELVSDESHHVSSCFAKQKGFCDANCSQCAITGSGSLDSCVGFPAPLSGGSVMVSLVIEPPTDETPISDATLLSLPLGAVVLMMLLLTVTTMLL